jgi:hypothetical protein
MAQATAPILDSTVADMQIAPMNVCFPGVKRSRHFALRFPLKW